MSLALAAALVGSGCGADGGSAADEEVTPDVTSDAAPSTAEVASDGPDDEDDDHDGAEDEDHDEKDGDDASDDHDGEDEDHDDGEHDDGEHDDEDHDDEDHDDHDDHDEDEDHDDHGEDEDHDDHDESSGGLGAHEHGTAELSVAWIDTQVAIDLVSPTFNVFGFEYEPTSDEDLAAEADRTQALAEPNVASINDEAGCTLIDPVTTEVERDGSHSEITVSWLFECENADEVSEVDFSGLFAEFPNFENIDVQWVSNSQQSSAELSPSAAVIALQR